MKMHHKLMFGKKKRHVNHVTLFLNLIKRNQILQINIVLRDAVFYENSEAGA